MKRALVTLAIGKKYRRRFEKLCYKSWRAYAEKYNLDLVVITEVLDESERANNRSPAWQKCLILSQTQVKKYDQVAWVDSDILINPTSPNLFNGVPIEAIGAVDAYATPNKEDHLLGLERLYDYWEKTGIEFVRNVSAADYHKQFGLYSDHSSVVQTGVIVLSPGNHREVLEHVYDKYDDKGGAHWNYEMRPLSYEILNRSAVHWLNPKFNMPWPYVKQFLYPFLSKGRAFEKVLNRYGLVSKTPLKVKCATTAFLNNYFLHFAGSAAEMHYVNQNITSIFSV